MFERKSEIRAAARRQVREQVQREETARIQSVLQAPSVVIPPEIAEKAFGDTNGKNHETSVISLMASPTRNPV